MNQKITALLSLIASLSLCAVTKASVPPVAKLVEPEGNVEYRRGSSDWKIVKRTKYLFEGYGVRTGKGRECPACKSSKRRFATTQRRVRDPNF